MVSTSSSSSSSSSSSACSRPRTMEQHRGMRMIPLLWLSTLATASPVSQHRVGRSHRHVAYQHVVDEVKRNVPSKFFFPEAQEYTSTTSGPSNGLLEEETQEQPLEFLRDSTNSGHSAWSVVADAMLEHPLRPHKSRLSRHDNTQTQAHTHQRKHNRKSASATIQAEENSASEDNVLVRRRLQIVDKFVEDSTSAVVVPEESEMTNGLQDESDSTSTGSTYLGDAGFTENQHENYEAYNVTAEVLYNVSEPEGYAEESNHTDTASTVLTGSSYVPDNSSATNQSTYQPLRIRAILSEQRDGGEFLSAGGRAILLNNIIRPALLTWSAALRVEPVVGNLTVDESQLFDNQTCGPGLDSGLPSPKVPSYHLTEGMPETDMILYLSIGFAPGALTANMKTYVSNETLAAYGVQPTNASESETKPYLEWTDLPTQMPTTYEPANSSIEDSGMFRNSAAMPFQQEGVPFLTICGGDYVAAASYCSTDQYDRPTAGMLHICIDEDFFLRRRRSQNIVTIMHEVGHALGFNSRSMAHFRRPDGSPVTPRVNGEIVETEVACTGPSSARRYANVTLPSEEILQFRNVRGGVRVAEVVTPSVLQVVRNHFDCQELDGAELESGEYSPLAEDPLEQACIGDHWERRLFRNDLMNPVVDEVEYTPFVSTITLAYFADSGWYQVDLSMAELAASWGRGAGCSFVEDTCIADNGQVSPSFKPFFCNALPEATKGGGQAQHIDGCTSDLSRKAACSLGEYDSDLPPEYQYFGSSLGGSVGGADPFIDYCPTYTGFVNGLCSNVDNAALLQVNHIERFGSKNSRCLSGVVQASSTALCLPIACVVEDRSMHVKIDGTWRQCESKDHELKVFEQGYVVCPDPRRVCPTFYCHHDCLGTSGRCDYDSGACVCATKTDKIPGSTSVTGSCSQVEVQSPFAVDAGGNLTVMPHESSPLSDYYFETKVSLQDDQTRLLTAWQMILLTAGVFVVVALCFWYFRLRRGVEINGGSGEERGSPGTDQDGNPNKHKMIASVLVDMRMNSPDASSVAPTADTAASLCGLESAASADSSLCPSFDDDRGSVTSEELLEDVDAQEAKRKSSMRKRRWRGHF